MQNKIKLRPAKLNDIEVLLTWRNDPITIANSSSRTASSKEDYSSWLTKCLNGQLPGRLVYIAENEDSIPIGSVRAIENEESVEISYTIDPFFRGKGLGKVMVIRFVAEYLKGKKLKAIIKNGGNEASESIAKAIGLKPVSTSQSTDPADSRMIVAWE